MPRAPRSRQQRSGDTALAQIGIAFRQKTGHGVRRRKANRSLKAFGRSRMSVASRLARGPSLLQDQADEQPIRRDDTGVVWLSAVLVISGRIGLRPMGISVAVRIGYGGVLGLGTCRLGHHAQGPLNALLSTVREITDALSTPSPCPLPRGARGHWTVISRTVLSHNAC